MARIELVDVSKVFRGQDGRELRALQRVGLEVGSGELMVLVGPSASGKSTLLRLIAGLEDISEGTIRIGGRVVNGLAGKDRDVAMVFQNSALYPHMSAYENMAFGLKLRKHSAREIRQRVTETAEMLGVTGCLDRRPAMLSGGERQRVALARAIVRRPSVFLFDEPLSNLDPPMRAELRAEILQMHQRLGVTMLYVTHDQVEAMALGNRVSVLDRGVIRQTDDPLTLYRHPANLSVARFIGSPAMNCFRGRLIRQHDSLWFQAATQSGMSSGLRCRMSGAPVTRWNGFVGKEIILGLRPEHIGFDSGGSMPTGHVEAILRANEPMGPETFLHFEAAGERFVMRTTSAGLRRIGESVLLVFDLDHAHFFDPATEAAVGVPV